MSIAFLDLKSPHLEIRNELDAAYYDVIEKGIFINGPQLEAFENEFAIACGSRHCVGVGNGLDALKLILHSCGIGPGDEVIVPANTFIATWLAVTHVGATPVPVEPLIETYNIDPEQIESSINARTRAIIPVHLYGQPANMNAINEIAKRKGLIVIEDAAQSQGAVYHGRYSGSLAFAAAHSFYPGKNLGALGDAGAITTNDDDLARRLRMIRNYGSTIKYRHEMLGFNSRLDELQAAFLRVKLRRLPIWNERRRQIANRYKDGLLGLSDIILPSDSNQVLSSWHLYVVRTKQREAIQIALNQKGIETGIHYPKSPHLQEAYAASGFNVGSFPLTEKIQTEVLSLPIGPHMNLEDADLVIRELRNINF